MDTRDSSEAQIEQLWRSLRDELRRHGADAETAEDIVQDTWLIALRRPPSEHGRFRGWLHVVAIRLWQRSRAREYDRLPRERAAARLGLDRESSWDAEDLEVSRLRKAVNELPEPYGTTLRLRFFEGLEVEEIAERLSIKTTTVYTQIRRGLFRLRERIEPSSGERRLGILVWLGALRTRLTGRSGASLRRLGVALAAATVLPLWLLWNAPSRPGPELVLGAAAPADAGTPSASVALRPPAQGSAPSRRESAPAPATPAPSVRLSGIVLTPDGAPLAGALVHVDDDEGPLAERTALSDEHGRFEIVASGELVWATHEAWCESSRGYVASLGARDRVELRLSPTRGRAVIEVVTHAGLPAPGARVQLGASRRRQQLTTPRGTLELSGATPGAITDEDGRCELLFSEQPETELFVEAPGEPAWRRTVETPAAGTTLRVELPAPLALGGVCRDETGRGLARARVEVLQHAGLARREAVADAEGRFRVDSLGPGEFLLRASGPEGRHESDSFAGRLAPGEEPELTLELHEGSSIFGRVVDEGRPVARARVELEAGSAPPAAAARRTTVTDERGAFVFAGCAPELTHDLQVYLPGSAEACVGLGQLRAGSELLCEVPPADEPRAPLELAFAGLSSPALVELRRVYPALSVLLHPDLGGTGYLRSPPLPAGTYRVFAWSAELGTWEAPRLEHDPRAPEVHALSVPEAATLAVALALPEGIRREAIEVQLLQPSFHRNGLNYYGTDNTRRHLPWREHEAAFVGSLAPGEYLLVVRGEGMSEHHQTITVASGAFLQLEPSLQRGVETTLFFESLVRSTEPGQAPSRGLQPSESLLLEALTPSGPVSFELRWRDQRRVEGGFEFVLALPATTTELRARTRAKGHSTVPGPLVAREGLLALEPDALAAPGRPRLRVALQDASF